MDSSEGSRNKTVLKQRRRSSSSASLNDTDSTGYTKDAKPQSAAAFRQWNLREKKALLEAIDKHGFTDSEKLTSAVETRSPTEVSMFMDRMNRVARNELIAENVAIPKFVTRQTFHRNTVEEVKDLDTTTQWMRVLALFQNEVNQSVEKTEIIKEVFQKIYESYPEKPENPVMPNFKNIYRYICDLLSGTVPTTPPAADICVLFSLKEEIHKVCDFDSDDETRFIRSFHAPIKFVSEKQQTECSEEENEDASEEELLSALEEGFKPATEFPIDDDRFKLFHDHQAIVTGLNPLSVPAWLLMKKMNLL